MKEAVKFYSLLGLQFPTDIEDKNYLKADLDGNKISFYTKKVLNEFFQGKTNIKISGFPFSIAIRLQNPEEINRSYKELKRLGYQAFKSPEDTSWGQRTAFFLDPDGNLIEINAQL
jgi:catechol 2,3-dioxygenase-like lactoylglutathione lyase family enzyme